MNPEDLARLAGCYDEGFGQSVGAYGKFSPDGQQLRITNTINDFSVLLTPIAIDRVVVEFGGTMTFQIDENGMVRGYEGVTTDGIRYTAVRVDDELCARAP